MHACVAGSARGCHALGRTRRHDTCEELLKRCTGNCLRVLRENGKHVLGLQITAFAMLAVRGAVPGLRPAAVSVLLAHGMRAHEPWSSLSLSDEMAGTGIIQSPSNDTLIELKAFGPGALAPVGSESSVAVCANLQLQCTASISKNGSNQTSLIYNKVDTNIINIYNSI